MLRAATEAPTTPLANAVPTASLTRTVAARCGPATVRLSATAADWDSQVRRVGFYRGDAKVGEDALLTHDERFRLTIEAMARKDWHEADRLEDTCPRFTYRCEDAEFRDRMRRVHLYTLLHALEVEGPRAKLRLVEAFAELAATFSQPVVALAEVIFRAGRDHGLWEAGASLTPRSADAELTDALREVGEAVAETTVDFARHLAEGVRRGLGKDVAAQREGFGRFCRETLGLEPATLLAALGVLGRDEDNLEDIADPAASAGHAVWWAERWARRFAIAATV